MARHNLPIPPPLDPQYHYNLEHNLVGVCRYCGCTESAPCIIPAQLVEVVGSRTCAWLLPGMVCNAPDCLKRHYNDLVVFIEPTIIRALYGEEAA